MCVCVCVCVHGCMRACVHTQRASVRVCVVVGIDVDGCIRLIILVNVCQCCYLLMFVGCLLVFRTLSLLLNLVNKESERSHSFRITRDKSAVRENSIR